VTAIIVSAPQWLTARAHLRGHVEQVGFFLADFNEGREALVLRDWRAMPPEAFEHQSEYHVTLRDEARPELIAWAWNARASLVEIHSHGETGLAQFSPSDIWGFGEWVPHIRWRLRGSPYAAIVTAGASFDALVWVDDTGEPAQVSHIQVDSRQLPATARTLSTPIRRARGARRGS
jgi:hypothetical protein